MKPAQQRSRHLAPGDKLGKYDLIRQIAIGGMAELYLARTLGIEGFEKLVVVKRILPQFATNASFVNMFLNEARLAATLHHPNVAQVYDIGVEDGDYFFAMEYVHGEDLESVASQSIEHGVPLSLDAALTLIAGLCAGLHYAHERVGADGKPLQIVHRDVSPSNVLVSYDGGVKLVDFGIARAMAGKSSTTKGGLKGKIVYMSPEQCRSESVLDRRSDVYSIGTLLYELTVGRTPFAGETEYAVLSQIVNHDVPAPTTHVPGYPPALETIVMRALARDPAQRYPTALLFQGELEDFAHDSRLRVSPLVLARLMSSLFPARLEEWDNAKSQGAFFVEQHVVRTLIEDGRSPAPDPRAQRGEEDTTPITTPPVEVQVTTAIGPPPVLASVPRTPTPQPGAPRLPTPPPGSLRVQNRVSTPAPGSVPIMSAASAGTLVSSSSAPDAIVARVPSHADVTERVRFPTPHVVRTRRSRLGAILAIVALGGGAAAFIVMRGGEGPPAPTAAVEPRPVVAPPPPPVTPPPPAEVAPPPPVEVAPPPPVEVAPPQEAVAPEPVKPEPKPRHVVRVAPKPRPTVKPVAKPEPKPEEKPWNADSPFMPVRTDKH